MDFRAYFKFIVSLVSLLTSSLLLISLYLEIY